MTQSSRRVFLVLAGALLLGAIVQRSEVLSKKEQLLTQKPKRPLPTPTKRRAISSSTPTPMPSKETTSPTPTNSPTDPTSPKATQTAAVKGVVIAKSDDLILRQTKVFSLKDSFGISASYSLTRTSRGVVAFDTRCTHAGAPCLLSDSLLLCPAHDQYLTQKMGK